jgi:maltose alpha-D-glucosyltransferase / alpha-amylase
VYGYQAVNVEAELRNPNSFLHWFRRILSVRQEHPVFGLGSFEALHPDNSAIFAYIRKHNDDIVLCVNNLSRFPQPVELDLRRFEGMQPVELLGGVRFPSIGELPYLLTLGPYSFYWFRLLPMPEEGTP